MDNLSDLQKALPPSNKNLLHQSLYKGGQSPHSSNQRRGTNISRGGFSNQRGPGRGRSRVQGQFQNVAISSQRSSWGNDKEVSSIQNNSDTAKRYTFKETSNGSSNNINKAEDSHLNSAEEQLKQIGNKSSYGFNKSETPKIRNTVDFKPDHTPAEMRVLTASSGLKKYHREITSRDVIIVSDLFCRVEDKAIYHSLLKEAEGNNNHEWKLWHGDNHLIADDRARKNQSFPTFDKIINTIEEYFSMDIHATRFNWFRNTQDWKPYHHDAAAIKPEKAAVQNITVAVSFGTEREIAFQHAKSGSTVSFPLPNGTMYTFSNDVNVIWRHGVPQVPPEKQLNEGRISIVAWGWVHGVINVGNTGAVTG